MQCLIAFRICEMCNIFSLLNANWDRIAQFGCLLVGVFYVSCHSLSINLDIFISVVDIIILYVNLCLVRCHSYVLRMLEVGMLRGTLSGRAGYLNSIDP